MTKYPSKNVFGRRVKYRLDPELDEKLEGLFSPDTYTITLNPELKGKQLKQVILHEEIHAIFHRIGVNQAIDSGVEEIICDALSSWLVENYKLD